MIIILALLFIEKLSSEFKVDELDNIKDRVHMGSP